MSEQEKKKDIREGERQMSVEKKKENRFPIDTWLYMLRFFIEDELLGLLHQTLNTSKSSIRMCLAQRCGHRAVQYRKRDLYPRHGKCESSFNLTIMCLRR